MVRPGIPVTLSSSSIFSLPPQHVFATAEDLGYDGVEIMVTQNRWTHDPTKLDDLSQRHSMPIHAVHAPTLLFTQQVWGSAWTKVARAADLARELGAEIVVVHPPFRWQGSYALDFADGIRDIMRATGVTIAVENMYPWRVRGTEIQMYLPDYNPIPQDYDHITWDFSHAATAKMDSLAAIKLAGSRLAHVHLTDGSGLGTADEHLLPGYGHQRVVESLHYIAQSDYDGAVCVEVSTRGQKYPGHREEMLAEALGFAREHLARTTQSSKEMT